MLLDVTVFITDGSRKQSYQDRVRFYIKRSTPVQNLFIIPYPTTELHMVVKQIMQRNRLISRTNGVAELARNDNLLPSGVRILCTATSPKSTSLRTLSSNSYTTPRSEVSINQQDTRHEPRKYLKRLHNYGFHDLMANGKRVLSTRKLLCWQ